LWPLWCSWTSGNGSSAVAPNDADQFAATRTLAASDDDAADRTRSSDGANTATGTPSAGRVAEEGNSASRGAGRPRLPAPLQYRDPDRYEVVAEHGRGGLGRVLRARDRELGRSVAIKELLVPSPSSELRFFREAMITASLEHPGIVPVHEAGRWPDGTPFYAMKLVAGRPLTELIKAASSLAERLKLIGHVIAVADAVAYAHSRGIVHRDLKPANTIVGDFGETVVVDWGLAKEVGSDNEGVADPPRPPGTSNSVTVAGSVVGTPAYMSPEQASGAAVDVRSDVFSMGALLRHTVTGTPVGSTLGMPAALASIIRRATAIEPKARYQSAREFADDLRRLLEHGWVSAHAYSLREIAWVWLRRNRAIAVATTLFVSALLLGAVLSSGKIVRERDLAHLARNQAVESQRLAEEQRDEAVLATARALLSQEPSEVAHALQPLGTNDVASAAVIAADAAGRGTSTASLTLQKDVAKFWSDDNADTVLALLASMRYVVWRASEGRVVDVPDASAEVSMGAVSPDGKHIAVAAAGGVLVVRDSANLGQRWAFDLARPTHVWFSSDTSLCGADSNRIQCWDVVSGANKASIPTSPVTAVTWSESTDIAWCSSGLARWWRRGVTAELGECADGPNSVLLRRDGSELIVKSPREVRVVSRDGKILRASVNIGSLVAFAPGGQLLVAHMDGRVTLDSVSTGTELLLASVAARPSVLTSSFSEVAFGFENGQILFCSDSSCRSRRELQQGQPIAGLHVAGDNLLSLAGGQARVWRAGLWQRVYNIAGHSLADFTCIKNDVFLTEEAGNVTRLSLDTGSKTLIAKHAQPAHRVGITIDGRVISAGWDGVLQWTDWASGLRHASPPMSIAVSMAVLGLGDVATVHMDGTVRVWHGPQASTVVNSHGARGRKVLFSENGRFVTTTGDDGALGVYDTWSKTSYMLPEARAELGRIAFRDEVVLVTGSDGHIRGFHLSDAPPRLVGDYFVDYGAVSHVAALPDARVVGIWDQNLLVVLGMDGSEELRFRLPGRAVTKLVSAGGEVIVATTDGAIVVYDALASRVAVVRGSSARVQDIALCDGLLIATFQDGTVRTWAKGALPYVPMVGDAFRVFLRSALRNDVEFRMEQRRDARGQESTQER
jgi:eukaryotic-like serine/threonine-protein kinase